MKYRHYKTKHLYEIVIEARVEASPNDRLIIYRSLHDGQVWSRPIDDFFATVPADGGLVVRRFQPVEG